MPQQLLLCGAMAPAVAPAQLLPCPGEPEHLTSHHDTVRPSVTPTVPSSWKTGLRVFWKSTITLEKPVFLFSTRVLTGK